MSALFTPIQLAEKTLSNRLAMAPMTRSRADADGIQPAMAADYYTQRATAGLIITEATAISKQGSGYPNIPGIWNDAQVNAWKPVADAVHAQGGSIFMQLFHTGRIGHISLMGETPVAPSAIAADGQVMTADYSMQDFPTPRALKDEEIEGIVRQFAHAAANAEKAGFDGIEIHAANGYLLDQFLRDGSNRRQAPYGGSVENRYRLLKQVTEAAIAVWGDGKVGVRLSPTNGFNSMQDSNPMDTFTQTAAMLNGLPLAYLHIVESKSEESALISAAIRKAYTGVLMLNGGYLKERAEQALEQKKADMISIGAPYIANPDLLSRLHHNWPLAQPDQPTFYSGGAKGYTDYPPHRSAAA
ncbi:alkene reductase [bacterium]|nr:alkene reductase [bacterium]